MKTCNTLKMEQLEIDFVANKDNKRYYAQSAYDISNAVKMLQEIRSFDEINNS